MAWLKASQCCPACGGQNGHNVVHVRHETGGGGSNVQCPLDGFARCESCDGSGVTPSGLCPMCNSLGYVVDEPATGDAEDYATDRERDRQVGL